MIAVLYKLSRRIPITCDEATSLLSELAEKVEKTTNESQRAKIIELGEALKNYTGPSDKLAALARKVSIAEHNQLLRRAMMGDVVPIDEMLAVLRDSEEIIKHIEDGEPKNLLIQLRDLAEESITLRKNHPNPDDDVKRRIDEIFKESNQIAEKIARVTGHDFIRHHSEGNFMETVEIRQEGYDPWALCEEEAEKH